MSEIQRLGATPAGVNLGPLDLIPDGKTRNFVIETKAGRFHGFAVRRRAKVYGFVDRCPHTGLPLAKALDDYLTGDGAYVICAWHGALFDAESGLCRAGPCKGQALTRWPLQVVGGAILTA